MSEIYYAPVVYMRDLDGTGSLHQCSKEDPGAVAYIPAESTEHAESADHWPTRQKNAKHIPIN